jgi:hypothetical protein
MDGSGQWTYSYESEGALRYIACEDYTYGSRLAPAIETAVTSTPGGGPILSYLER